MLPPVEQDLRRHGNSLIEQAKTATLGGDGIAVRVIAPDVLSACMLDAADEIERLRSENKWLKAQLPSSPEAAAAGGGFDPYNP